MAENKTPQVTVIDPVGQEKAKLRVAAYARVSSDSTDQLNSYLAQPLSPSGEPPPDPSKRGT